MHLLRGHIVDAHYENGFVLVKQALQLVEVHRFCARLAPHDFFEDEVRMFKGKDWFGIRVVVVKFGVDRRDSKIEETAKIIWVRNM